MIDFIDSLSVGTKVVINHYMNIEKELKNNVNSYPALQSLGLGAGETFNYLDSFAMIGEKGAAPGTAIYMKTPFGNPSSSSFVKSACLQQCSHKCTQCLGHNGCDQCSHNTRENAPLCTCKDTYYEDSSNSQAECN